MKVDPIAAEARAVEYGRKAVLQPDSSFLVASESRRDVFHRVMAQRVRQGAAWFVAFRCTCESGQARPSTWIPCWHASAVGRRLQREGRVRWDKGRWRLRVQRDPIG